MGASVQFTYLDAAVIFIISFLAIINARKGLARALFKFLPTFLGVMAAWKLSPVFTKFLRGTAVFSFISEKISTGLHIDEVVSNMTLSAQNLMISEMQLPEVLKSSLINNNNPVIYNIFDVDSLGGYISSYISNMLVNVVAVILLFIAGIIVGNAILKIFDLANDLPIIGGLSRFGGFLVGILKAVCFIWIVCIVITFFCYQDWAQQFIMLLERSFVAGWFYRNNILLYVVLTIIA